MPTTTNADPTTTTLPACLTRTTADDRAEAEATARRLEPGPCADHAANVRVTLSAIQRREADAVDALYRGIPAGHLRDAIRSILNVFYCDARTAPQRATLLDCARGLVKLAIEVAG